MWVAPAVESVFDRVENIVGKGENAGNQYFLLLPTMFSKGLFVTIVKTGYCVFNRGLALYLICQFYGLPIQQQIEI